MRLGSVQVADIFEFYSFVAGTWSKRRLIIHNTETHGMHKVYSLLTIVKIVLSNNGHTWVPPVDAEGICVMLHLSYDKYSTCNTA